MKKFVLFAMALTMMVSASANQFKAEKVNAAAKVQKMQAKQVDFSKLQVYTMEEIKAKKVQNGAGADTLYYGRPEYAFNMGVAPGWMEYNFTGTFASTYDSLIYKDASVWDSGTPDFGWKLGEDGKIYDQNEDFYYWAPNMEQLEDVHFGKDEEGYLTNVYNLPVLIDNNGATYQFGSNLEDEYAPDWSGLFPAPLAEEGLWPMTSCGMYTSPIISEDASGSASGSDMFWMPWSSQTKTCFMGTGMAPDGLGLINDLVVFFGTPNSTMTVDTITLVCWSYSSTPFTGKGALDMRVINWETGEELFTYSANMNDFSVWEEGPTISIGTLEFPYSGTFEGEIAVVLSGFQDKGVNIGCFTDISWMYCDVDHTPTYMVVGDKMYSYGNNIALNFNAGWGESVKPEGISNTAAAVKAEKVMKNGQLIIRKGDKTFNAVGQIVK